ncbi:small nuclear RNA activating complex, polypeptide 3 [Gaertneriomyces sp. JEL0708]|nr:small nuclear RNA activating complex, polypeptide 3 [Gaertneriomyces sp. JEL0708]
MSNRSAFTTSHGTSKLVSLAEFKAKAAAERIKFLNAKVDLDRTTFAALAVTYGQIQRHNFGSHWLPTDFGRPDVSGEEGEDGEYNQSGLKPTSQGGHLVVNPREASPSSLDHKFAKDFVDPSEILVKVAFYSPGSRRKEFPSAEFIVCGSQTLADLRDVFYCPVDFLHLDDVGPASDNSRFRKTSASYFLIENVIFDDTRNPSAPLYSHPILHWANKEAHGKRRELFSEELTAAVMSETSFEKLNVRFNAPYKFVHQGNCEHCVLFTEARLITPLDDVVRSSYPKMIRSRLPISVMNPLCHLCKSRKSELVTLEDPRADKDLTMWCPTCYDLFHLREDGSPEYNHEVHKYAFAEIPDIAIPSRYRPVPSASRHSSPTT